MTRKNRTNSSGLRNSSISKKMMPETKAFRLAAMLASFVPLGAAADSFHLRLGRLFGH